LYTFLLLFMVGKQTVSVILVVMFTCYLFSVHFVNLCDVLPSECILNAVGGISIEVLGHCQIPIQLENGFLVETDFIISPSIKEPMLGINWLTRNASRWNFLEGTIII